MSSLTHPWPAVERRRSPREIQQDVRSRQALRPAPTYRTEEWVRKVKVFVGSPGDAKDERQAVKAVAERVERTLGGRLDIDVFLWEEHVAPHLDRQQAVVFRDIPFEEMDLFVFVFRSRLGTPTGACDRATGEEFESGTLEEIDLARRLCETDARKRLMVYFCDHDVHPAGDEERRQWEALRRYRDGLETGPGRGLYGMYREKEDFAANLAQHLQTAASEFLDPEQKPPSYDGFVAKLCDRIEQDRRFGHFFREGLALHPGVPQAAIIWGESDQAHDSFIDRIRALRVQAHADEHWKGTGHGISQALVLGPRYVAWPTASGDAAQLEQDLKQGLHEAFRPYSMQLDYSASALMALPELHGNDVIVLKHDLHVTVWNEATADLLEWYLDRYWGELGAGRAGPGILVLIKIDWDRLSESSRRNMRRDLTRLCTPDHSGCRRILLPELTGITGREVKEWLSQNALDLSEERSARLLADLFGDAGAPEPRSMAAVEAQLRLLLDELGNPTRGRPVRGYAEN